MERAMANPSQHVALPSATPAEWTRTTLVDRSLDDMDDLFYDENGRSVSPPPTPERVSAVAESFLPAPPAAAFVVPHIHLPPARGASSGPSTASHVCSACNGYYGPAFSQPVCATCHAFLYANDLDAEVNLQALSQAQPEDDEGQGGESEGDDSDRDSGNEEPTDQDQEVNQADEGAAGVEGEADDGVAEGDNEEEDMDQEEHSEDEAPPEAGDAAAILAQGLPAQDLIAPAVVVAVNQVPDLPQEEGGEVLPQEEEDEVLPQEEGDEVGGAVAQADVMEEGGENDDGQHEQSPMDDGPGFFGGGDHVSREWISYSPLQDEGLLGSGGSLTSANVDPLSRRLAMLAFPRPSDAISEGLVAGLPPEVLLHIFSFLDDLSLYSAGNVCRRWNAVLRGKVAASEWQVFTRRRWPLFRPICRVADWFSTFSALIESCFCLTCVFQMAEVIPADFQALPLREKRLVHDLRLLVEDPPPGIKAQPLDSSNYHWQASLTGPAGSPYEGGIFFLYLKVPFTYPFDPPEVRFLTRIFHPNVSRHGDIGIDSILQHNWVSGLTIPKVLISIQSLLTDPYTTVCMEPGIGDLYRDDRKLFDAVAKRWTWRFAMHDAIPPKPRVV